MIITKNLLPKWLTCIVCCLPFLFGAQAGHSEIYKWVDENGKVHFGDRKIEHAEQEVVVLKKHTSDWSRFDIDIKTKGVALTEQEHLSIIDGVNNVYEFFDRVLFFDIYTTVPVNILILKDKQAYQKYLKGKGKGQSISTYGIYLRSENQIIVYVQEDRQRTFKTIKHEVSHAVVDTIVPYAPAWLNEGLAEQMEMLERNNAGLYLDYHAINRSAVADAHRNGKLASLDEFLKLPSKEWRHTMAAGQGVLQAQAGQFLYFLLSKPTRRNFVVRLMHNFDRGDRTLSYYLVNDNYIGGISVLKLSWGNWLQRQSTQVIEL